MLVCPPRNFLVPYQAANNSVVTQCLLIVAAWETRSFLGFFRNMIYFKSRKSWNQLCRTLLCRTCHVIMYISFLSLISCRSPNTCGTVLWHLPAKPWKHSSCTVFVMVACTLSSMGAIVCKTWPTAAMLSRTMTLRKKRRWCQKFEIFFKSEGMITRIIFRRLW